MPTAARDQLADARDVLAEARDVLAQQSDLADEATHDESSPDELWRAARARFQAAEDRYAAARDRYDAARDRYFSAGDRAAAHLDELTGALRRGAGRVLVQHEIDRARRHDGRLVAAYVDVDDLKLTNDRQGHAAGDQLLCDVVKTLRRGLRSYDAVIRDGGDEFVCTLSEADVPEVEGHFADMMAQLSAETPGASFSVGLALLRADDDVDSFIRRADEDLLRRRSARRT